MSTTIKIYKINNNRVTYDAQIKDRMGELIWQGKVFFDIGLQRIINGDELRDCLSPAYFHELNGAVRKYIAEQLSI